MPAKTVKMRNPKTGTVAEFSARRAKVRERQGWEPVKNTKKKNTSESNGGQ